MKLTQLYKHTARNTPFMRERKISQFTKKLQELRDEYIRANEVRRPEIQEEAEEIKEYLRILGGDQAKAPTPSETETL